MIRTLIGGMMLAAGVLIAALSGLCTVAVVGSGGLKAPHSFVTLPDVLTLGGVPFGLGIVLILAGRALIRAADRDRPGGR